RIPIRLAIGLALTLWFVLPLYLPPAPIPLLTPGADATALERIFPNTPLWWVVSRMVALLAGSILVASCLAARIVRPPATAGEPAKPVPSGRRATAALLAALAQLAVVPWLPALPRVGQYLFMLWLFLPAAMLAYDRRPLGATIHSLLRSAAVSPQVGALIGLWAASRLLIAHHSPVAADGVDMWRTFGRLVQVVQENLNFLTSPMDPQLPGVTTMELLFHGLPLLDLLPWPPTLTFSQFNATCLIAIAAVLVAWLSAALVDRSVAVVAVAAFLFSPLMLIFQMYPLSAAGWLMMLAALAVLVLHFYRTGSAPALALIGPVAGMTASFPTLNPLTAVALLVVAWRLWRTPRPGLAVIATTALSAVAGFIAGFGLDGVRAIPEMISRYYLLHWSWAVAELVMMGQMSPTIHDWVGPQAPPAHVIPLGALLSPIATARNSLRVWGDVMFEPWSIVLFMIGLAACLRSLWRERTAALLVVLLLASMIGGFTSTYDRPSQLRTLGSTLPLALLSAAGAYGLIAYVASERLRRWAPAAAAAVIALSGTLIFDVINARILAASALGLVFRSVDEPAIGKSALLTVSGQHRGPARDPLHRFYQYDWLLSDHPYVTEIIRTVPPSEMAVVEASEALSATKFEIWFWSPALEETAEVTRRICGEVPGAVLFTIRDRAGLSRVYAATRSPGWQPDVADDLWQASDCSRGVEPVDRPTHLEPLV
ncbi:MAG TPA: hypothetical protein VEB21_07430, partial [Terriglobales bacterium]|nr:hypothetical protein [Terriglobales bacterium]